MALVYHVSAEYYPCHTCGKKMLSYMETHPLGKAKVDLPTYICDMHNSVSTDLGKDIVDCSDVPVLWGRD